MARLSSAIIRYNKYRGCVHSHHARPRVLHTIGQFPPVSCHSLPLPMDPISKEISGASSTKLQLYSYWQSSCSWRVRFALNLKEFERLNPICFVPVLVDGDLVVSDSFAILLYLDEKYPQNALLPVDIKRRAVNLQAASIISSSIQPLQMQSVLKYIEEKLSPEDRLLWAQHYILKGFTALEELLKDFVGKYATGDEVYMADVFLAPQINVASARFNIDMSRFPTLNRINEAYKVLPAFQASLPERQPDAKIL
ncbi:glutathione S-transferase zeta class-like isoform X2 [Magnolia sinica]|uniref:glutathione S-transferase zeta class-like isoform X2 n=1 Tax=Magnolia sinica TaxID=86752 RepID=UPI002657D95D|nr:glutathione S-transferase zeta class-like isoform X2 [Magnolia sinica]